jgi:hypothetical protein
MKGNHWLKQQPLLGDELSMPSNVSVHPQQLALADLKRSGLNAKDFKILNLKTLTSDETLELTGKYKVRSVQFPYLDPRGKDTGFYRLRFLDEARSFGNHKKSPRYWQPPDTVPRAYFTPYIDWPRALDDPKNEIWITEGEKKAAAACKAGIATIGLGGVWSWRVTKTRIPLIPDLVLIPMRARLVKICFDTDAEPKPLVTGALEMLGHVLGQRGAIIEVISLPLLKGQEKTGLDDFLIEHSPSDLRKIESRGLASAAELAKLNDELTIIINPSAILHTPTGQLYPTLQPLTQILYAHKTVPDVDAAGRLIEVNAVSAWMKWPGHNQHNKLVFEPGAPRVTEENNYNLWNGWPVEPKRGNVSLFNELLNYTLSGLKPDERKWLMQWFAWPLQNPGAKLYTALVLWSQEQGTGKTLLANTFGRIYGEGFSIITEHELHGTFNDWAANKQLVLGEEITGSERKLESNRLKHLITGDTVLVNKKFQPPYTVRNCANFIFTTNDHDAFLLDRHDRRYFVHEVGGGTRLPDNAWFTKYDQWFRTDEAIAAIFYYLLQIDMDGFNPKARAPETKSRAEMIAATGTHVDMLIRDVLAAPDVYMRLGDTIIDRDLFTVHEIISMIDPERRMNLNDKNVGAALQRAGSRCQVVCLAKGQTIRLRAMRNLEKWNAASHQQWLDHYRDATKAVAKPAKF